jgi:hypothetical protein
MWWDQPRLIDFPPLLPPNILDVAVRAYAVVEVGGMSGTGPEFLVERAGLAPAQVAERGQGVEDGVRLRLRRGGRQDEPPPGAGQVLGVLAGCQGEGPLFLLILQVLQFVEASVPRLPGGDPSQGLDRNRGVR